MLNRFSIRARLTVLIGLQALFLVAMGAVALSGLGRASSTTLSLDTQVNRLAINLELRKQLRANLLDMPNRVSLGIITWSDGLEQLAGVTASFDRDWKAYMDLLPLDPDEQLKKEAIPARVHETFAALRALLDAEDYNRLKLFLINDMDPLFQPVITSLNNAAEEEKRTSFQTLGAAAADNKRYFNFSAAVFLLGLVSMTGLGLGVYRSITRPLRRIASTLNQVAGGDYSARTGLSSGDEICRLGLAFDDLLQDKVTNLAGAELENDRLNDSVIGLLQAVSRLSNKDLTARATITDDLAGPLADAINQLATETGSVMAGVQRIAAQVDNAASQVNSHAIDVNQVSKQQRGEVAQAAAKLVSASEGMNRIASLAEECNSIARHTIDTTKTATDSVQGALTNIQDIREIIQETGKRIKRLGERSQEISGIVDIINGIAERTTVLALNASMQAAAAGDAGRGFAVVADEVQRLAESSRNATGQISTLVKNIQVETGDTMSTMNRAIDQVVSGSLMAEKAGAQMQESSRATADLVRGVGDIADNSSTQARVAEELLHFATVIREQVETTGRRLEEQLEHTSNLTRFANELVGSVRTFKLEA
ncbi:MAG: HAMP domain-containing protein [Gammaproteobacteria bacterium]|nr:HAMP domain-containing protein [Gammaproteobacteria bacterium]MBU1654851.1 HAMP domain-containing protein [Gammaproteobacteria bacterium]MBU1961142.1 HAMP domain-containing protein [Gammaproteobacteria bacterium]